MERQVKREAFITLPPTGCQGPLVHTPSYQERPSGGQFESHKKQKVQAIDAFLQGPGVEFFKGVGKDAALAGARGGP